MLHRTFSVVALAATIAVIPAGAGSAETDEVWSCGWTWAASPTGKDTVYMTRYQVKGSVLLSGSPPDPAQAKYQILDNNECGLVASHGFSDDRDGKSNVVVSTVQIDKKTGRYRHLSMTLASGVPDVTSGTCMSSASTASTSSGIEDKINRCYRFAGSNIPVDKELTQEQWTAVLRCEEQIR